MFKLSVGALFLCLFFFSNGFAQNAKIESLLKQILDLPAPAPRDFSAYTDKPKRERDAAFLSEDNVPPDDAPIEDLVDYWTNQNSKYSRISYQIKPSSKTVERLLDYADENPEEINNFLNILPVKPEVGDKVKQIFDKMPEKSEEEGGDYQREAVENWLKSNSRYYLGDLINKASKIKDQNNYVANTEQDILRSLARVDWDSAKPFVDRFLYDASQPYSQILAKWVSYEHALAENNSSDIDRWRGELKRIVEDKSATWAMRDLAMDALALSGEWDGRDDWYISLLEDETLLTIQDNGYTGLTTMLSVSKPGKFTEAMIRLTKSSNFAARSAAVRNLMGSLDKTNKELLEALLPWLFDAKWVKPANESQRLTLISFYTDAEFPEAVPGLIAVVQNEKDVNRAYAALALAKYKDARAVPALRAALTDEQNIEYRRYIIGALVGTGGVSDDEQMTSLEQYATLISTPEGLEKFQKSEYYYGEENVPPQPLPIIIGKYVADQEEPSEGLAIRAVERLKVLKRTKPAVAQILAGIMQKWKGRVAFLETIRQIKAGEADVEAVLNFLAKRKDSREKMPNELVNLRTSNGIGRGLGACIIEEDLEYSNVLGGGDVEAQTAMFGCARLIRAKLPLAAVGGFLSNANPMLALAAERYLETEDSVEARQMILAKRPNDIVILGAQEAFVPNSVKTPYTSEGLNNLFYTVNEFYFGGVNLSNIRKSEENLRNEMKQNPDLLAVYAFAPNAEAGLRVVRLFKDKVVYTNYEDTARYTERNLTKEEYEEFLGAVIANKIDSLSALGGDCEECVYSEFLMFGRGGGRRVSFTEAGEYSPPPILKIRAFFDNFDKGDLRLNYWLASKVKGLEIMMSDKKFNALAVWKKDADFRVLVEDKAKKEEIEKQLAELEKQENSVEIPSDDYQQLQARYEAQQRRRLKMQYDHYFWRKVENGLLGANTTQPAEMPYLFDETQVSEAEGLNLFPRAWQVRSGNSEIRVGVDYYQNNLFKVSRTQAAIKIKDGTFQNPIVTGDGKWVVASKSEEDWVKPQTLTRVNLQTRKEFAINIPPADTLMPIAFNASNNKVLIYRAKGKFYRSEEGFNEYGNEGDGEYYQPTNDKTNPSPATPEFYLLDAETGIAQIVKGEFRPFLQQTYRPLQPTGVANEFWAAIYDEKLKATNIGRYNDKTFKFTPVRAIPDINLNSMQIWVEEPAGKIYFVYQGHLLGLPLKSE